MPYQGSVGPKSTQDTPIPEPEIEVEPEVTVEIIEDDTPLSDEQVVEKAKGTGK